jgi:hypothetical protein
MGADGLPVVERATCPAPPPQGFLGSGLRAWPGPERVFSVCFGGEGWDWKLGTQDRSALPLLDHLENSWLYPHPSGQNPTGQQPLLLG